MKPLYRNIIVGLVILAGAISFLYVRFYAAAGQFTTLTGAMEILPECTVIPSVPGPEDIVIDHERKMAFVSAVDRRAIVAGAENIRGGIYAIDLSGPREGWALRPVTAHVPQAFQPHGIGLYIDEAGRRTLAVINHAAGTHSIELFDVGADAVLSHQATVTDPMLVSPNDVQPVAHDKFYVTNDHSTASPLGKFLQDALMLDSANLVYFDGAVFRSVAEGLTFPNGVNVSPDGSLVYVAETVDMALRIYARDGASGDLTPVDYVALGTGIDNLDVAPDGTILSGAHPKLMDFVAHAADEKNLSPSQVVRLVPNADGGGVADTVYLNLGSELSGSSVAALYGDVMLVGGVFDPKILACSVAAPR
ncbi:MAG: SMP-30/gluconolactonase/LRE family protein [Parvibaculum sp.]